MPFFFLQFLTSKIWQKSQVQLLFFFFDVHIFQGLVLETLIGQQLCRFWLDILCKMFDNSPIAFVRSNRFALVVALTVT